MAKQWRRVAEYGSTQEYAIGAFRVRVSENAMRPKGTPAEYFATISIGPNEGKYADMDTAKAEGLALLELLLREAMRELEAAPPERVVGQ